ncbi:hypothetical protein [Tranquillimonas alkanivorans]|uniref:Uncharacterized protein n=1 Tax=Tranquillimonas alkanivorans TaxID=441119 RepID=A0A1I5V2D7_9RHOB|nr:hypothetical protein [Tranquillimonas alkanivorans]SFQ01724.1 hypothetical protein SAMN04488047_12632 [Tranquillimonas alkanivorans]
MGIDTLSEEDIYRLADAGILTDFAIVPRGHPDLKRPWAPENFQTTVSMRLLGAEIRAAYDPHQAAQSAGFVEAFYKHSGREYTPPEPTEAQLRDAAIVAAVQAHVDTLSAHKRLAIFGHLSADIGTQDAD